MKKEYYSYDCYKSASSYGDFIKSLGTYTYDDETDSIEYNGYIDSSSVYSDLTSQIMKYYKDRETPEQKAIREAKEKAEKRNNTINQILGE